MKYGKLVRDNIPEIIKNKGEITFHHIASENEYWDKLKEKLKEETEEFIKDETEEELADILEIVNAICDYKKININQIEEIRKTKAEKKGRFEKRIILDETN